jgi:hypothetical protein
VLAAGAEASRRLGAGSRAESAALAAARRMVDGFREQNGAVDCFDLTDTDFGSKAQTWRFLLSGKAVGCLRLAARWAPVALAAARAGLEAEPASTPPEPVSCAALVARRRGAPERHAVMVAGFAGGLGLRGGACGALAATVWLDAFGGGDHEALEERVGPTVGRFLEASGAGLECAAIVGRVFADAADHAAHLRGGGCARILEVLAGSPPLQGAAARPHGK